MATSEEDVQAKRETVQQLREAIQAEKDKRSAATHQLELDAMATQLDDEIVRLNGELDYEKAATQSQVGESAPAAKPSRAAAKADTAEEK